jgi:hypothetical protein
MGVVYGMVEGIVFLLTGSFSAMSGWQIDEVTLPIGPAGIKLAGGINKEVMPQAAAEPINLVDGLAGTILTLSGTIGDTSKTDAELWVDVITPLLGKRGLEVNLACPIVGLNGVYLLESFEPSRDTANILYAYTLRLSKSSLNVIFDADPGLGGM